MRERVAAVGGSLDAGPRPAGGFRVSALLPLPTDGPP
jgi:signal transduction histidine kinase